MPYDRENATIAQGLKLVKDLEERLQANRSVRLRLPDDGMLHLDRQLPFLCLPSEENGVPDRGMRKILAGTAAYLFPSLALSEAKQTRAIVRRLATILHEIFGASFLIRVRGREPIDEDDPGVRVLISRRQDRADLFGGIAVRELSRVIGPLGIPGPVTVARVSHRDLEFPLSSSVARELQCHPLLIEVPAHYRNPKTGDPFPEVVRRWRRELSVALLRTVHYFSCEFTLRCPVSYHTLGRKTVGKVVWQSDEVLSEVARSFDFLLQATPTNAEKAWNTFRRSSFQVAPQFEYRALPEDPVLWKRKIWSAPVERIDDPILADLIRQKQEELDREVTLLLDRESPRFLLGSTQIYGVVEPELRTLADEILSKSPPATHDDSSSGSLTAEGFAALAREELSFYQREHPEFAPEVQVRDDFARGLMVSRGALLIGASTRISKRRAQALIQHEIGTHLVTFFNGSQQRLRLLATGLAGYDPFQEGIAVLAEYLVGGLTPARLRVLAARVVAADLLLEGASFVEVHRVLTQEHQFSPKTAYTMTMRVFRGGGMTKDAAYLRGFEQVLSYLRTGGPVEPLWIGKFAAEHLPLVRELQIREILSPPDLQPRFLEARGAEKRLAGIRTGKSVIEILAELTRRAL